MILSKYIIFPRVTIPSPTEINYSLLNMINIDLTIDESLTRIKSGQIDRSRSSCLGEKKVVSFVL